MSKLEDKVNEDYIAGLLAERAGYVQTKKKDRIVSVDAELKRLGYKSPKDLKNDSDAETAAKEAAAVKEAAAKATKAKAEADKDAADKAKADQEKRDGLAQERAVVSPVAEKAVVRSEKAK